MDCHHHFVDPRRMPLSSLNSSTRSQRSKRRPFITKPAMLPVVENDMRGSKDLEEQLLACYLSLRANECHDVNHRQGVRANDNCLFVSFRFGGVHSFPRSPFTESQALRCRSTVCSRRQLTPEVGQDPKNPPLRKLGLLKVDENDVGDGVCD
ncbi:hypothetical protein BHE74_00021036 [Ensete ventricosum]|nr:hypothetical protein BHE74_00021036 [Ensete ventricosum]